MAINYYRYTFREDVPVDEVEASLCIALITTEILHGEVQTRLETGHYFDGPNRRCVIDASSPSGADLNRLFAGFLTREFGPETFRVERADEARSLAKQQPQEDTSNVS